MKTTPRLRISALWSGSTNDDGNWPDAHSTVQTWISQYQVGYDMVADPGKQLAGGEDPASNPEGYLIDPRTMKVIYDYTGAPGSVFCIDELLEQNGAQMVSQTTGQTPPCPTPNAFQ